MPGSGLHQFELGEKKVPGLSISFFRDLEWFLLREDYFRMSPGHPNSVEREANSRQDSRIFRTEMVVEEDTGSGKLLFRSQENSIKYYINNYFRLKNDKVPKIMSRFPANVVVRCWCTL